MNYDNWKLESPPETPCKCKECGVEISIMQDGYCDDCLEYITKSED